LGFISSVANVSAVVAQHRASSWEYPISGYARATRKNGESALILQALCACKISALNEDCTSGMFPSCMMIFENLGKLVGVAFSWIAMTPELPPEIELTLLLEGGQTYRIAIAPDNPLLRQLFGVLVDFKGTRSQQLFQIPVDKGRSLLAFPCHRLVGVITEPPILLQQDDPAELSPTQLPSESAQVLLAQNPYASDVIQIDEFLPPEEHQDLLEFILARESEFVSTSTSTGDLDYRKSSVLYAFPKFSQLISDRIHSILPDVLAEFNIPLFQASQVESQLTAHNDGNYYKIHNDNGSADTASRELTYVYYFNRSPKQFSGGELRVYDSKVENNFYVQADTFQDVEPRDNSIVFFLSRYMHEVLPIACPSRQFADSRFTINGWVRR
jgi:SM-20-related protein